MAKSQEIQNEMYNLSFQLMNPNLSKKQLKEVEDRLFDLSFDYADAYYREKYPKCY